MKHLSLVIIMLLLLPLGVLHAEEETEVRFLRKLPAEGVPYREIGTIEEEGMMPRREYLIAMKEKAADMGANAIVGLSFGTRVQEGSCIEESEPWARGTAIRFTDPSAHTAAAGHKMKMGRPGTEIAYTEVGTVEAHGIELESEFRDALREKASALGADAVIDVKHGTEKRITTCTVESVPYATTTAIRLMPQAVAAKH